MKHSDRVSHIKLADIDLSDHQYRLFEPVSDTKRLAGSIAFTGLINPVLLRPVKQKYIVVSGFNRIHAFEMNRGKTIPAVVLEADDDPIIYLVKAIAAVSFNRALSQPELIKCIGRLAGFMDAQKIADRSSDIFGRAINSGYISELIAISCLPDPAMSLIEMGNLSLKAAAKITGYATDDIIGFLELFEKINASASVQLELLLHLHEIGKRDTLSVVQILSEEKLNSLLQSPEMDIKSRTAQIRNRLVERRFPHLTEAKTRTRENIAALKPGNALKINISDTFEDADVQFSFKAKSLSEFEDRLNRLKNISDQKETLKGLFSL